MLKTERFWIAGGHGGPATVNCDIIATYDGTNAPIIIASGATIAVTPSASVAWVLGPISVNGTPLSGVQSVTIDFGLTEVTRSSDGEVYATFAALMTRSPRISLTTDKATYLATAGITGVAQGDTDSVVYLRKVASGSTRVADATAEHISFTIDAGMIQPGASNFMLDQAGAAAMDIIPVFDGSNAVLVIDTTAAIA